MYSKIEDKFWNDPYIRKAPEDARVLMVYLLTCPSRNMIGLFHLPEPLALYHLGWSAARYQKARNELVKADRIAADDESDLIFIKNFIKWNPLENPSQVKCAITTIQDLPATFLFRYLEDALSKNFRDTYQPILDLLETVATRWRHPDDTLTTPCRHPDDTLTTPCRHPDDTLTTPCRHPDDTLTTPCRHPDDTLTSGCQDPGVSNNNNNSNNNNSNNSSNHNKNNNYSLSPGGDEQEQSAPADRITSAMVNEVKDDYNQILSGLKPEVKVVNEARAKNIRFLLKRYGRQVITEVFRKVSQSNFLLGRTQKPFNGCDLDWILKENNFVRIYEGKYDDQNHKKEMPRAIHSLMEGIAENQTTDAFDNFLQGGRK